ncbi:coiled-coil domain-containing protein [Caballeronia insecticola]|uniref:Uncharacterized protein n=1 Tax=Caballeronia insecticola TaxID=758793 RepID=A0A060PKH6_9BURK|nr:hypothetical protein [Caballeronia insecticola]BAO94076.1 putative uncharacterized protein [Caballeronia insecticola]
MSNTSLKQGPDSTDSEASDMTTLRSENALLFAQLHVVQEELERRHHKAPEIKQPVGALKLVLDDSRFPEIAAESLRYQKSLAARDDVLRRQAERSLSNRLGAAVVQGVTGPVALFGLPGKLWSIWRDTKPYAASALLGGKSYDKVIAAYREGGDAAVDSLLHAQPESVKASAMTMLARTLVNADAQSAARYARQAYELDPRPFRLKWLAFREHEAGRPEEGEALLDALPAEMKFSESEQRQVGVLRADARRKRTHEVASKYDYAARRRELEQSFRRLTQERTEQQALLEQQRKQLDEVRKANADLEQARLALGSELTTQSAELAKQNAELKKRSAELTKQSAELATQSAELATERAQLLRVSQSHEALLREHEMLMRDRAGLAQLSETQARENAEQETLLLEQRARIAVLEHAATQDEEVRQELSERIEALHGEVQVLSRVSEERDALIAQQKHDIDETERLRAQTEGARAVLAEQFEALQSRVQELTHSHEGKDVLVEHQRRQIEEIDRLREQWEQQCAALSKRETALQKDVDALSKVRNEQAELLVRQVDLFGSILGQQHEVANGFIKQMNPSAAQIERQLRTVVKEETTNANRQMQALIGLQGYYANGELPIVNPENSTWPISPDFALYLVQLIEKKHYDLIVEFGSGISTAVVTKTLVQKARNQSHGENPTAFTSFEHLPSYHAQTLSHLQAMGVANSVDLRLTPLRMWTAADGAQYSYYDCDAALESLSRSLHARTLSILVIVDGPPASVGKLARYPAAPLMKQFFPRASIDFLLDDYMREDEQRIAKLWQTDLEATGFSCQVSERRLEKGACLISARFESQ